MTLLLHIQSRFTASAMVRKVDTTTTQENSRCKSGRKVWARRHFWVKSCKLLPDSRVTRSIQLLPSSRPQQCPRLCYFPRPCTLRHRSRTQSNPTHLMLFQHTFLSGSCTPYLMSPTQVPTRLLPRWPFVHEKLRNGSVTKYTHRQHVSGCALNWMSMLRIVFPT